MESNGLALHGPMRSPWLLPLQQTGFPALCACRSLLHDWAALYGYGSKQGVEASLDENHGISTMSPMSHSLLQLLVVDHILAEGRPQHLLGGVTEPVRQRQGCKTPRLLSRWKVQLQVVWVLYN
jgi:hypothetical protein